VAEGVLIRKIPVEIKKKYENGSVVKFDRKRVGVAKDFVGFEEKIDTKDFVNVVEKILSLSRKAKDRRNVWSNET